MNDNNTCASCSSCVNGTVSACNVVRLLMCKLERIKIDPFGIFKKLKKKKKIIIKENKRQN